MENKFGLTDLTQNELKECNGGMALSIIGSFLASNCINRIQEFVQGIREGYARGTRL